MKIVRNKILATSILFSALLFLLPTSTHARTTTYIGNYEVTTEDNGLKKEVVRVAGSMGKVVKSRNILGNNTPSKWDYAYYTTDARGSTRQEISENQLTNPPTGGQIPKLNTYYAYGTPVILSGSEGSRVLNAQNQKIEDTYTGQKKDEETGLMYYNARYYNPATGLFLQADSVDDGANKYQYVAGNPVNNVDPSGNIVDGPGVGSGDYGGGSEVAVGQYQGTRVPTDTQKKYIENYLALPGDSMIKDPIFEDLILNFIYMIEDDMSETEIINMLSSYLYENIDYSSKLSKATPYINGEVQAYNDLIDREPDHVSIKYWKEIVEGVFRNAYDANLAYAYKTNSFICGNFAEMESQISNGILAIPATTTTMVRKPRNYFGGERWHAVVAYDFDGISISDPTYGLPLISIREAVLDADLNYNWDRGLFDWNMSFSKDPNGVDLDRINKDLKTVLNPGFMQTVYKWKNR